jgi:hypothetical protein
MRRRPTTRLAAVSALSLGLAAAGCGGGPVANGVASRSAPRIVATATRALQSVSSLRVAGGFTEGGSDRVTLDLRLVAGRGAVGEMSENGAGFRLIVIGSRVYINGGTAFWRQYGGSAAAGSLAGHWIRGGSGSFGGLASELRLRSLLAGLLGNHGGLVKGAISTVHGRRVIAVRDNGRHGTLYVATTGTPYAIELTNASRDGDITFSDFNARVDLTAPAHALPASSALR